MADFNFTLKRGSTGQDTLYPTTTWTQVLNKPSTFTPTAHSHTSADLPANTVIGTTFSGAYNSPGGGTNTGVILYGDFYGWHTRSIGSAGQVLTVSGGVPVWATPSSGATNLSLGTITATNVPINSSSGDNIATLPAATASLAGIVINGAQTFGGAKTFGTIAASTINGVSNGFINSTSFSAEALYMTANSGPTGDSVISLTSRDGVNLSANSLSNITANNIPISTWRLVKSTTGTAISHTTTSSTTSISLNAGSISVGDILAIEVSASSSTIQRQIIFFVANNSTASGTAGLQFMDTNPGTAGQRRLFSMDLRYSTITTLTARYCQYSQQSSGGTFGNLTWTGTINAFIHRIWKVN